MVPLLLVLTSLVPVPQTPPPSSEDVTISVRVLDESGQPGAGLPVSLVWKFAPNDGEPPDIGDHLDHYLDTRSSDASGRVRFEHAEQLIHPARMILHVVRLSIPQAERRDAVIPTDPLQSTEITLIKPATGRVVFLLPGKDGAIVRLRAVPAGARDTIPNHEDPCRAPVVNGEAEFAHVGLGTRLAYEIDVPEMREGPSGKLDGPRASGETVRHLVPGAADVPVLIGRIVDEKQRPVTSVKLCCAIELYRGGWSSSCGHEVVPDGEGRIAMPVYETWEQDGTVLVEIDAAYWDHASAKRLGHASAVRRLPSDLRRGPHDLGEVVLEEPGSSTVLEPLDDDALERAYRERQEIAYANGRFRGLVETCLLEMARRGGRRWEEFLTRELERLRAVNASLRDRRLNEGNPLECLIALRRAQRRPDPLSIEIAGHADWFGAELPGSPTIRAAIVNASETSIVITDRGPLDPQRCSYVRVDAIGPDGLPLVPPHQERAGGGLSTPRPFAPRERIELQVELDSYVAFPAPGDYRVRLQYHDRDDITDDPSGRGRLTTTSPWFTVHLEARPADRARVDVAALRGWVHALDPSEPAVIVEQTWRPGLQFTGKPASPADCIFRTGWSAVPILIDELGATDDAARRAWILALLYDLTGFLEPAGPAYLDAVGSCRWLARWPTVAGERQKELGHRAQEPSGDAQAALAERWRALGPRLPLAGGR